ncbi:MAG: hypothetical protein HKP62_02210, partial [Sulfurovum sp.]|nr:hypothetical protein [Sulfurovum sp.]NNJ44806.1 hypothetical protein [Sulfurovum sp.]
MKLFLLFTLFFTGLVADEELDPSDLAEDAKIHPSEFTVKLIKNCEVLALSVEPNRKAKKIYTNVWTEGCVQNLGCIREVTQKELDAMPETERDFTAWKYPVWCKVDANGKRGWVRKQFLADEPCKQQD